MEITIAENRFPKRRLDAERIHSQTFCTRFHQPSKRQQIIAPCQKLQLATTLYTYAMTNHRSGNRTGLARHHFHGYLHPLKASEPRQRVESLNLANGRVSPDVEIDDGLIANDGAPRLSYRHVHCLATYVVTLCSREILSSLLLPPLYRFASGRSIPASKSDLGAGITSVYNNR